MIRRKFIQAIFGVLASCYVPGVLKPLLEDYPITEGLPGRWVDFYNVISGKWEPFFDIDYLALDELLRLPR